MPVRDYLITLIGCEGSSTVGGTIPWQDPELCECRKGAEQQHLCFLIVDGM